MRQVFLSGIDVSQYVAEIPTVEQSAGEYGQIVINEISNLTGINLIGFWDTFNPSSPFFGGNISDYKLEIFIDGVQTYNGFIKNIKADNQNGTATVELRSIMQTALEHGAIYSSIDPETPATAILNICNLYKIPVDIASFTTSINYYLLNLVFIDVERIRPEGSVLDLIQQIAEIGCMRVYSYNQVLYCEVYQTPTQPSLYTFSDALDNPDGVTLFTHPETETIAKEQINGYNIETIFGPVTLGDESQQGKTLQGGADSPIKILSLQGGVFLGELWLKYLNRKQTKISFETKAGLGKVIPLGSAVTIDYTLANWIPTIIDLININQTDRLTARIEGITR